MRQKMKQECCGMDSIEKQFFKNATDIKPNEFRCKKCNKLLGKFYSNAEIKCPKCGIINHIDNFNHFGEATEMVKKKIV